MGLLDTEPAQIELATTEEITYGWNVTNYTTASGDTSIEGPSVICTDVTQAPAVVVTLPDQPTVVGLDVLQELRGTSLVAGHRYTLVVTFTGVQSGQTMSMRTLLVCPF